MSEVIGDPRAELRERIIDVVMNQAKGKTFGQMADAILAEIPDSRLTVGGNYPPPDETIEPESREDFLLSVDPESLLRLEPAELPELFATHYPFLVDRAAELKAMCEQWQADHKTQAGGWIDIKDNLENEKVAEIIRQADDFADEVDGTRVRVKARIREAGDQIDGFFKRGMAEPVIDIRGVTRTIGGKKYLPPPGSMQFAQTKYLVDKAERERQQREAAAKLAQEEANRIAEAARRLAEAERQRIADLEAEGVDAQEAQDIAQSETDMAAAQADAAQASSSLIGSYATAPAGALVRQRTAMGTTIGLTGRWTFDEDNVDMTQLCAAVGAPALTRPAFIEQVAVSCLVGAAGVKVVLEAAARLLAPNGPVPATFVATDGKNIRAAITARTAPLRSVPGLTIFQQQSASRRGG
jgi:hypothetical protein